MTRPPQYPTSRVQYLHSVAQLISNTDAAGKGIKASTLGNLILRSIAVGRHWRDFGYVSLKLLLEDMSAQGVVRLGSNPKDGMLTVWVDPQTSASLIAPPSKPRSGEFKRVRREIWAAFVISTPGGDRFLNKRTGSVLLGQSVRPEPRADWVQIDPITIETQKKWAQEFLDSDPKALAFSSFRDQFDAALRGSAWYRTLPQALRGVSPLLASHWNRTHSEQVTSVVERWRAQHEIQSEFISGETIATPVAPQGCSVVGRGIDGRRQQVLEALAKMTTDELLSIPIPGRYLLDDKT